MKKKDLLVLKEKNLKELGKILEEKKSELTKTLIAVAGGKEKNLKRSKFIRKEIAQFLTIISEKGLIEKEVGKKK